MYYILYTDSDGAPLWELVSGEDAMQQRVDELAREFALNDDDIIVFDADSELNEFFSAARKAAIKYGDIHICDIWPVSTEVCKNGGIGIDWSSRSIGFGQLTLYWGDDGRLHADTEFMGTDFARAVLSKLADELVLDDIKA